MPIDVRAEHEVDICHKRANKFLLVDYYLFLIKHHFFGEPHLEPPAYLVHLILQLF